MQGASLVAYSVKNLPAVQESWVRSLDWEDPLEKEMANHSSILAWKIPWTEELGGLQFTGSERVGHNLATKEQQSIPLLIMYIIKRVLTQKKQGVGEYITFYI